MTVGDVAHAAEAVLDALSKGALKMSGSVLDKVQSALDTCIRCWPEFSAAGNQRRVPN